MNKILYFFILFVSSISFGQSFHFQAIPSNLLKDAYAVVRFNETSVDLVNNNLMKISKNVAITVLDKSGDRYASAYAHYNPNTKIDLAEATLYNAQGQQVKKFKSKDFQDMSAVSSGQMYTDDRVKYLNFTPISYPYTLHYQINVSTKNTLFIPKWFPIDNEHLAIEKSIYQFSNKTAAHIRSKEYNFKGSNIIREGNENNFTYRITDIPAVIEEEKMLPWNKIFPYVVFASNTITYDGVSGEFDNWESYGKWSYDHLVANRLDLTPQQKSQYQTMVAGAKSEKEKIEILYKHLQQKVRYIGVQLGIGGFSPFPASYVESKSYGDCKALSNYMIAMLDAVDIKGYHTVLHAGDREDISEDFMYQQGNHMIVYVPLRDEEIWLEATSQDTAFNYLGNFGSNRKVLIYSEEGGRVIDSQQLGLNENMLSVQGEAKLSSDGRMNFNFTEESSGLLYDNAYRYGTYAPKDLEASLKRKFNHLHGVTIEEKEFENNWKEAKFIANYKLNIPTYAKKQGNMFIFNLIPVNQEQTSIKKVKSRTFDFTIDYAYIDEISYTLTIPNFMEQEIIFEPIHLSTEFGVYSLTMDKMDPNHYKITRRYQQFEGIFSKDKYNDYVDFRRQISGYDQAKILIDLK